MAFGGMSLLNAQTATLPDGYVARKEITARGLAPGMKVKELAPTGRTFQVHFTKGDEVASGLTEFAEQNQVTAAHFTGVGAFGSALLGWTDPEKRAFKKIEINQEAEVVAFAGDITLVNGKPSVHAHTVVALSDGSTRGGHFLEGHVSIVMDVYVVDSDPGPRAKTNQ
jgi:predicted DNA-binding protein with PD1-like motif